MKKFARAFFKWLTGQLGPFLIMLIGTALTTDIFKGFFGTASDSFENFMTWVKDPIPFARWLVFTVAVLLSLFVSWSLRRLLISRSKLIQLRLQLANCDETLRNLNINLEQAREEARETQAALVKTRLELSTARLALDANAKSKPRFSNWDLAVLNRLGEAHRGGYRYTVEDLAEECEEDRLIIENSLEKLRKLSLVLKNPSSRGWRYGLTSEGIKFLVENVN